jgi:hypothetical protein
MFFLKQFCQISTITKDFHGKYDPNSLVFKGKKIKLPSLVTKNIKGFGFLNIITIC